MGKYQQYAEYKDSGVEWVGKIPSHWITCSLSKLFNIKAGGDVDLRNFSENQTDEHLYPIYTNANDDKSVYGYSKVANYQANSITVSGRGEVGFAVYRDHPFEAIIRLLVLTPQKECHPKFYAYYINEVINFRVESSAIGQLSTLQISPYKTVLPSIDEQKSICNFLDHETAKIDSLIEKQQQLIQLLKEKRQAVISHAVTKGLNPDVAMKDSGVEWLGEVPEHWDTTKIKYVAELTPKKSEVSSNDNRLCTFVPMEKLKLGSLIKDEEKPISEVIGGYTYFKNGDLLLAKVTPCFENKNMVVASDLKNGIGFGSSEIYVLRTNHKVNTQFLYYRLQEDQFMELGTGAMTGAGGLKRVPSEFLNNFEFALPPLSEQIAITKYLNQYLIKNEYLMNKAQSAIQLMQERRTALISVAVTGKIDVRNWQNPTEAKMEFSA